MTRKEAIVFLKNANAQSELALKELLKIEDKAKRIGKIGEYYANFENCVKEIEACNIAISALEELEKSQTKIGGWIPCSERLPEEEGVYLVTKPNFGNWVVDTMYFCRCSFTDKYVIAWQPLPEVYHG